MTFNFTDIMSKAQKMQEQMQAFQESLAALQIVGQTALGEVKVTLNGRYEALRVEIDDAALTLGKAVLEDLTAAAFNDAHNKVARYIEEESKKMTSGLGLPMNLPFMGMGG